ncbi:ABC transporter ATP-binding protein [Idiomarina sp. UBA3162]|mgnify:CR=1 FL=1|uniref:ABC transporter ATP-binding protein n=1 Tax=Idiomarina sp. UBA3162 TaxID=1946641 RepID=UPI000C9053B8|nr:ABC transporter ATP-binding protein [Idiomarina sp. UBA3162]MAD53897.1 hypothetical protein [Idiomarinaceae bacterium]|tara:strand:- start:481 stop:1227 length:747 start_codon:yes stop_codon:yes gene_type:complete
MLELNDLYLAGISRPRIRHINLALASNQLVGVIGANGAGKSSLLRGIAAVEPQLTGQVQFKQKDWLGLSHRKRQQYLGYLPQTETPEWDIRIDELVNLAAQCARPRLDEHLRTYELLELKERRVSQVSGGERQRALLARATLLKPQLLICDEPVSGLDVAHQLTIMQQLRNHARNHGLVLAAIHDLALAARFCDRLLLMHNGDLVQSGEPFEVLTEKNLADCFGVQAEWFCRDHGVGWIPTPLQAIKD